MQLFGTLSTWHHLEQLEQMHRRLPPLQDIFARWQNVGMSSRSHTLALREHVLGVATLSGASLLLLYDLASPYVKDLPERIYWHAPTQSAAETQAVLPPQVLVQKRSRWRWPGGCCCGPASGNRCTRWNRGDPSPGRLAYLGGLPSSVRPTRPPAAPRRNSRCCLAWSRYSSHPTIPVAWRQWCMFPGQPTGRSRGKQLAYPSRSSRA